MELREGGLPSTARRQLPLKAEEKRLLGSITGRALSEALAPTMMKASAFSVLVCGLACAAGCQSDAEPLPGNSAGSASAGVSGVAGSAVITAGTNATAGSATATAGSAGAGTGGQATAGTSAGGTAGAAQGGSAGANAAGSAGAGGGIDLPPLEECTGTPSVDRLTSWSATSEGTMVPASGSILVKDGADYVGKVQFVGGGWHVVPVLIANKFDVTADLSKASAITLTYSATAELHVQLRSKSHWSGGDQYATTLPSNGRQERDARVLVRGRQLEEPVRHARALVRRHVEIVGDGENTVAF